MGPGLTSGGLRRGGVGFIRVGELEGGGDLVRRGGLIRGKALYRGGAYKGDGGGLIREGEAEPR